MGSLVYIIAAFAGGFLVAWIVRTVTVSRIKRETKGLQGLLESERLMRETAQKENNFLLQSADTTLLTTKEKLRKAEEIMRMMDSDILLLQKSNEETEDLLAKGEPALHEMKLKLIEANNAITRYKAQLGEK